MKKLIVILKQHTPLIHFQHEQDGATLRASEIKPRLDRFIILKLGNGNYDAGIARIQQHEPNYFTSNHSLKYKMRITNETEEKVQYMIASYFNRGDLLKLDHERISVISNAPYFAQESENRDVIKGKVRWDKVKKKGVYFPGNICVNIVVFDESNFIIDLLKDYVQEFFVTHNFGTRQSKGFGSFSVEQVEYFNASKVENIKLNSVEAILKSNFEFVYKKEAYCDEKDIPDKFNVIFSTINNDYRLIKSGTNRPYSKSLLMLYFKRNEIRWEKKFIKCFFADTYENLQGERYVLKSDHMSNNSNEDDDLNYVYVRALLGLAGQYEFLLKNPPLGDSKNKLVVTIKSLDENIQRYQSPLLYKVYNNTVFLVGNDVDQQIKGAEFSFLVNIQGDQGYRDDELGTITTPVSFSLPRFIDYALCSTRYVELKNNRR